MRDPRLLNILYEDEELLVLNKPEGVPSAPLRAEEAGTALGAALEARPALARVTGLSAREPALLHRLDTRTSGCLALAKTPEAFERLRRAWKEGGVRKTYRALVLPRGPGALAFVANLAMTADPFLINTPLAHHPKSKRRMIALRSESLRAFRGKPLAARTWIRHAHQAPAGPLWELTVEIETGVMHQIRCHLASLELPVSGDLVYGDPVERSTAPRMALHAWRLELPSRHGARVVVESLLPWEKTEA